MKTRPLINEANLQKLSKSQQFLIRSKPHLLKCPSQIKTLKNTQTPLEQMFSELKSWVDTFTDLVQQEKSLPVEQNQKVLKLLLQIKEKHYEELSSHEAQQEAGGAMLVRQSEGKTKQQTGEQQLQTSVVYPEELVYKIPKSTTKLKLGKQNYPKSSVGLQVKLQKLQCKLVEQDKLIEQSKNKVKELSAQIDQANIRQIQLTEEKNRLSDINGELNEKLSQEMQNKIELNSKVSTLALQHQKSIKILSQQLKDREKELISIFQHHIR